MLRKLDKKNYIFFLLIVFLILSSTHNSNLKYNNFFKILENKEKMKISYLKIKSFIFCATNNKMTF